MPLLKAFACCAALVLGDLCVAQALQWHTNPTNGHDYALTPSLTWTQAEALAVSHGGHLATVRSAAENAWLHQVFTPARFWIGLNDELVEGQWVWSSGESVAYTNWGANQPDFAHEDYVHAGAAGAAEWNNYPNWSLPAVIEVVPAVQVTASAQAYGAGCGSPPLQLTPGATPVLGSVGTATITSAPTAIGGVTMGFDDQFLTGLPILPLSMAGLGMPGCELLHSNDVFGLSVTTASPGTLNFSYSIPTNAILLGSHVYLQAYCWAPGANQLSMIASNGIDWLVGNQ